MRTFLKIVGLLLAVIVVAAAGVFAWAMHEDSVLLSRTIQTHRVSFPIPFPAAVDAAPTAEASPAARDSMPAVADAAAAAAREARARGEHLIHSRYVCTECHGTNFGGGVMVKDAMIGTILGPNLTTGRGSRTLAYTAADWDRAVRHGVKPDGTPSLMPAEDFQAMSDQELSDLVTYIRSLPPVDADVPRPKLGPLGRVLLAFGKIRLAADIIPTHTTAHLVVPPEPAVNLEFGQHLAGICAGCHRADFTGGPIVGGDPSWPPAANLTPHADGLPGWTYDGFKALIQSGNRPDGAALRAPMTAMLPYLRQMSDVERQAIWMFLQSVPAKPSVAH
jgi:mono/diheme cytochrome c family protein